MKTVIGIVGEKGSGKDTFANTILKVLNGRLKVSRVRSSDILAETLDIWHLAKTRHNLQHLAIFMDQGFGVGTLTEAVKNRILASSSDVILFDAVRWQSDADMIRSFDKNILVYIKADFPKRYERTKLRKEKIGEEFASYQKFLDEEKVATELEIPEIGESADEKIDNNGTLSEFEKEVENFCSEHLL